MIAWNDIVCVRCKGSFCADKKGEEKEVLKLCSAMAEIADSRQITWHVLAYTCRMLQLIGGLAGDQQLDLR